MEILNQQIAQLERKDKILEDQLQVEYSYKRFMIDVKSVFPQSQPRHKKKNT